MKIYNLKGGPAFGVLGKDIWMFSDKYLGILTTSTISLHCVVSENIFKGV